MTYSVVTSWLYPNESGRDICSLDFDSKADALDYAKKLCEDEVWNFSQATGVDALFPERVVDEEGACYIITPKNGLDEWFFRAEPVLLTGVRIRSDVD